VANIAYMSAAKLVDCINSVSADRNIQVRILSADRLALGADPLNPGYVIDFSKEKIEPFALTQHGVGDPIVTSPSPVEGSRPRLARRSGEYWFEMKGQRVEAGSLKELLAGGLRALEAERPGTLEKLTQIKPRSRRIVAHDPGQLFDRGHLVKDYAERLMNGWWFGTNNSAPETNAWLERACACSGLVWGEDFKTSLIVTLDDIGL
jgi:hypothetical protein